MRMRRFWAGSASTPPLVHQHLHAAGQGGGLPLTALDLGVVVLAGVLMLGSAWLLRRLTSRPD